MSKLINEDWEHAAYANDKMYRDELQYIIELEWQEWEYEQQNKHIKPAIIIVEKQIKNENTHITKSVPRAY